MKFGAHVSAAGGVWNAPAHAAALGCEVLQFFSRPPQGGNPKPLQDKDAQQFKSAMKTHGIKEAYIHAPYFINLASVQSRTRFGSVSVLRQELERGSLLGCRGMMFHPGSAKDTSQEDAKKNVVEGLNRILDGYEGACRLLIEISAGAGMVMGDTFEELAEFLDRSERGGEMGICFDTQHAFASGYDFRTQEGLNEMLGTFDRVIGLERMIVSHCNDSKVPLGAHKDRHEHLGEGCLGKEAFRCFVRHPDIQHIDLILETPFDEQRKKDMEILTSARS